MAVLVVGGGLGGAFAGGIAVGKSQDTDSEPAVLSAPVAAVAGQQAQGTPNQSTLDQLRQRLQGGDLSNEELEQLRQQFQAQGGVGGQFPGGFGGGGLGFAGRGGLTGAIEGVEGDTVTINTPQGPLQATIGPDTVIQTFAEATNEDLQIGILVSVVGERGEDGTVEASTIIINPNTGDGFLFGGR